MKIDDITVTIQGIEYELVLKNVWLQPPTVEPSEPKPEPVPPKSKLPLAEDVFDMPRFYAKIRDTRFRGGLNQAQVDNINLLLSVCIFADLDPLIEQAAYVLGTVFHETDATMEPIEEYGGKSARYAPWYGRGHVQLTWKTNYQKMEDKLGHLQIVKDLDIPWRLTSAPHAALVPETSALICVLGMRDGDFTGRGLGRYINDERVDYRNARRIVNGLDKAALIAGYAEQFKAALEKL